MAIKAKGVTISFVNSFFTVLTALVFLSILVISTNVNNRFHAVEEALDKFIICEQSSELIKESSSYLTDQARLFVVTHNERYVRAYLEEIEEKKRQSKSLETLKTVCSERDLALQRLKIALDQGQTLVNMELYAMRLVYAATGMEPVPPRLAGISIGTVDKNSSKEKMLETAINDLFGEGYLIYKTRINENCRLTVKSIEQQIKDELNLNAHELGSNINRLRVLFLVLLVVNVLVFLSICYLVILPLKKFLRSIKRDEKLSFVGSREFKNLAQSYNEVYDIKLKNEQTLLKKAEYDALTGILNRHAFDEVCKASSEKRQRIALLLIDLDNFKHINDTYGHTGGDNVLKALAKALHDTFRENDYVARIGGDEFAAILPNCTRASISVTIKRKIAEINDSLGTLDEKPASISVGVAFSEIGFTEKLYENADSALYLVKEKGKRGCEIYEESVAVKAQG